MRALILGAIIDRQTVASGKNPFQLDSKSPRVPFKDYALNETRYNMLFRTDPESAMRLMKEAEEHIKKRWHKYEEMAK